VHCALDAFARRLTILSSGTFFRWHLTSSWLVRVRTVRKVTLLRYLFAQFQVNSL
jgi:hypothetical protein